MRRGRWVLVVVVLAVLLLPSIALADNFHAPTSDDALVSWQYSTILPNRYRSGTAFTINNSYQTTDLNFLQYADGHDEQLNNYYTVTNDFDENTWGYWNCVYFTNALHTNCKHGHIRYNGQLDLGPTLNAALACHETGHSVGLDHFGPHSSGSTVRCMQTNPVPADPYMGPHNAALINANYT
jgi:hypothetical protein